MGKANEGVNFSVIEGGCSGAPSRVKPSEVVVERQPRYSKFCRIALLLSSVLQNFCNTEEEAILFRLSKMLHWFSL